MSRTAAILAAGWIAEYLSLEDAGDQRRFRASLQELAWALSPTYEGEAARVALKRIEVFVRNALPECQILPSINDLACGTELA